MIGKCGGTYRNIPGPGQGQHEQQMITSDPSRKPREGDLKGDTGRREFSVKAGKNLVQADLVKEIVVAAMLARRPEAKKHTKEQKGNLQTKTKQNTSEAQEEK